VNKTIPHAPACQTKTTYKSARKKPTGETHTLAYVKTRKLANGASQNKDKNKKKTYICIHTFSTNLTLTLTSPETRNVNNLILLTF
jgi:hypothetical protein